MDFDEITRILEMMREHELSEFELERDAFKLRIRKQSAGHWVAAPPLPQHHGAAGPPPVPGGAAAAAGEAPVLAPLDEEMDLAVVKSPIVGSFYRATEPGARPFAEVGDVVQKGQVLCIIEAMKLMNEIESEFHGELVEILMENGQTVQYGDRLFAIRET